MNGHTTSMKRNRISVQLEDDVAKLLKRATRGKKRGTATIIVNEAMRSTLKLSGVALPWSGGAKKFLSQQGRSFTHVKK